MTGSADTFPYTFGIEEEFFLSHPKSRSLALASHRSLFRAGRRRFGAAVASEMLQAQVELISPVLATHAQAEETLTDLRRGIAEIAIEKDLRLLAAGTHPIAPWSDQARTRKARITVETLARLDAMVARHPGVSRDQAIREALRRKTKLF